MLRVLPGRLRLAVPAVILVASAGCGLFHREDHPDLPSDGNVVAMFLAANNTDISYAQVAIAPGRTSTAPVLAFAHRMLDDHMGLTQAAAQIITKTGIVEH